MNMIKMIASICAMVSGVAMVVPQSFLWIQESGRPKHLAGRLPTYSPDGHADFICTMVIGNRNINLDPWLPILFAVGVVVVGAGAWGLWRIVKGS